MPELYDSLDGDTQQCEALTNPGTWPYAKRCPNVAVITTEDNSLYCEIHEDNDE